MKLLSVVPLVSLVLLAGCGNLANVRSFSTPYDSPSAGETARLRVSSDGMLRAVPGLACVDWRHPGAGVMVVGQKGFAQRNGESLGMPKGQVAPLAVSSELKIAANTPITFSYIGQVQVSRQCFNTVSFVPEAGADYDLRVVTWGGCPFVLKQLKPATDGAQAAVEQAVPVQKASLCSVLDNF